MGKRPVKGGSAPAATSEVKAPAKLSRAAPILQKLKKTYPGAHTALLYRSPFELLIATILSAQCTDERVNKVTPTLFSRFPTPADFASADRAEIEELIRSTGFFRNKARSIQEASRKIVAEFGGQLPETIVEMIRLPGVARKTANVVLGNALAKATGVVVDTHVFRLAKRMGLSKAGNPEQVEKELMALFPQKDWIDVGNLLILHGRAICIARAPRCEQCVVESLCPKIGVSRPARSRSTRALVPSRPSRDRIKSRLAH